MCLSLMFILLPMLLPDGFLCLDPLLQLIPATHMFKSRQTYFNPFCDASKYKQKRGQRHREEMKQEFNKVR